MATYQFTTINTPEGQAYVASQDDLDFTGISGARATNITVDVAPYSFTIRINSTGASTVLGAQAGGEILTLPDGSKLAFGGSAAETLSGGAGADHIYGGAGQDQLVGRTGPDLLEGGDGYDTFVFAPGDSGVVEGQIDMIGDWEGAFEKLDFSNLMVGGGYSETTATSYAAALQAANQQIATGATDVVSVQVGTDVVVFADTRGDNGGTDDAVILSGRTLAAINSANVIHVATPPSGPTTPTPPITSDPGPPAPSLPISQPTLPPRAASGGSGAAVTMIGNIDLLQPGQLQLATLTNADPELLTVEGNGVAVFIKGTGFTYENDQLVAGVGTMLSYAAETTAGQIHLLAFGVNFPAPALVGWVATNDAAGALGTVLGRADSISGGIPDPQFNISGADLLRGFGGNDTITGGGGRDTMFGGAGDDAIYVIGNVADRSAPAPTYLRGDEGNDYVKGGAAFDDINGNTGNDTAAGGDGDDWVVGGKDNDLLFGDAGADIVYGNIGADTCDGGSGNDIVRGGQDNDVLWGGAGDDYVSGDKGDDTVVGGVGADIFHTFGDAGLDRVLDFSIAQGDRVMVDPGTQYTVSQVGADTVIDMTGGGQMTLVGVQMNALTPGWIFGA